MAVSVVGLVLVLLSMAAHSDANYCVCNSGVSDAVLQKNIDYACANGADCSAINPNGACYNPNTVKDHCNYAVNSYYQKKANIPGSCNFQGTATLTPNPPSGGGGCSYQSSPSSGGTTTPPTGGTPPSGGTTTPPTGGTPPSGGTTTPPSGGGTTTPPTGGGTTTPPTSGGTTTPPTGGGTTTPPSGGGTTTPPSGGTPSVGGGTVTPGIGGTPTMGSTPGISPPGGIGLAPTGTGLGNDASASVKLASQSINTLMLVLSALTLLASGSMCRRV